MDSTKNVCVGAFAILTNIFTNDVLMWCCFSINDHNQQHTITPKAVSKEFGICCVISTFHSAQIWQKCHQKMVKKMNY